MNPQASLHECLKIILQNEQNEENTNEILQITRTANPNAYNILFSHINTHIMNIEEIRELQKSDLIFLLQHLQLRTHTKPNLTKKTFTYFESWKGPWDFPTKIEIYQTPSNNNPTQTIKATFTGFEYIGNHGAYGTHIYTIRKQNAAKRIIRARFFHGPTTDEKRYSMITMIYYLSLPTNE